ncbi:MAG TPA: DinB family protein [Tepidisphaeraceae bacterium]|nr:DinB family protein [Tepidisphaeraceae bacterium]
MTMTERLCRHDAWTTRALLVLAQDLPDESLDRAFDVGHRTLRRTFAHVVANMECWHDLMAGRPQRAWDASRGRPDSIANLIIRLDTVAADLLRLATEFDTIGDADFTDYLDRPPRRKPLGAGLLHVATHGMHHRAQCLYLMRMLGVPNLIEGDALSFEAAHRGLATFPTA